MTRFYPGRRRSCVVVMLLTALGSVSATAQNPFAAQVRQADAIAELASDGDLHVVLCGTNGPLPAANRAGPCTAILAGGHVFVVDAGSGSVASLADLGLPLGLVDGLLLTHFHSDHIADVGEFNFAYWTRGGDGTEPLDIWGPEGVARVVDGFTAAYVLDLGYRVEHHTAEIMPPTGASAVARTIRFEEGRRSAVIYEEDGLRVTSFLVDHPPIVPSVGYRFDYAGRSVVVSGDTKRSSNLIAAARGVDLLVHEAIAQGVLTLAIPALRNAGNGRTAKILEDALDNHTFPRDLYSLAAEAGVGAVVVSHLVPPLPPEQADRAFQQGREAFGGDVWVGRDGMHFVLAKGSQGVRLEALPGQ